eukprot:TRINITY_DN44805_c0_g1_i2.p1 TRINITY_DN44805_c0_g1~~TRINITY_DN44805_c0_g1_i2.p1  ORF type:complete len:675 (+),score=86.80 TRINITY_DN44805_c0_g1_i2:63-2027(+)
MTRAATEGLKSPSVSYGHPARPTCATVPVPGAVSHAPGVDDSSELLDTSSPFSERPTLLRYTANVSERKPSRRINRGGRTTFSMPPMPHCHSRDNSSPAPLPQAHGESDLVAELKEAWRSDLTEALKVLRQDLLHDFQKLLLATESNCGTKSTPRPSHRSQPSSAQAAMPAPSSARSPAYRPPTLPVPVPSGSHPRACSPIATSGAQVVAVQRAVSAEELVDPDPSPRDRTDGSHGYGFGRRRAIAATGRHYQVVMNSRSLAQIVVRSGAFHLITAAVIVFNAVLIGKEVDDVARGQQPADWIRTGDMIIGVYFCWDLLVRILAYGLEFFCGVDCGFNILDTVLVCVHITDALTTPMSTGGSGPWSVAKILRFAQLGRCTRIIRILKFVPNFRSLIYLVSGATSFLGWTILLIGIALYMPAVFIIHLAKELGRREALMTDDSFEAAPAVSPASGVLEGTSYKAAYTSIWDLMWQLFQAVTGGKDWIEILDPILFEVDAVSGHIVTAVFCLFVVFTLVVIMNLVTGAFVQKAQAVANNDEMRELEHQVMHAFRLTNEDCKISSWEFNSYLDSPDVSSFFQSFDFGLLKDGRSALFTLLDVDGSGTLSLQEIVRGTAMLQQPVKKMEFAVLHAELRRMSMEIAFLRHGDRSSSALV